MFSTVEEAILQTMAEFSRALDERRFEDWSETFTTDGVFDSRARRCTGRAAILERILETELAHQPDLHRMHTVQNVLIDWAGDNATASSDLVQFDQVGEGACTISVGRYTDRLAKQPDGRWLFSYRHVSSWDYPRTPPDFGDRDDPASSPASVGSAADVSAIRATLARYCRLLDDRRFVEWASLFADDAVFITDTPHHESRGRSAILAEIFQGKLARVPGLRREHASYNVVVRPTGPGTADVTSDFWQIDRQDGQTQVRVGRYADRLVRSGNRWLIAERTVSTWPLDSFS